jgi:hypothetical protein
VQVLLAAAIQDLHQAETARAVETLLRARAIIETSGVRNPYTLPIYVWLATACRIQAERDQSLDLSSRRQHIAIAESALRVATPAKVKEIPENKDFRRRRGLHHGSQR